MINNLILKIKIKIKDNKVTIIAIIVFFGLCVFGWLGCIFENLAIADSTRAFNDSIQLLNEDFVSDIKETKSPEEFQNLIKWHMQSKNVNENISVSVIDLGNNYGIVFSACNNRYSKRYIIDKNNYNITEEN